jgi:hypothetical protein
MRRKNRRFKLFKGKGNKKAKRMARFYKRLKKLRPPSHMHKKYFRTKGRRGRRGRKRGLKRRRLCSASKKKLGSRRRRCWGSKTTRRRRYTRRLRRKKGRRGRRGRKGRTAKKWNSRSRKFRGARWKAGLVRKVSLAVGRKVTNDDVFKRAFQKARKAWATRKKGQKQCMCKKQLVELLGETEVGPLLSVRL